MKKGLLHIISRSLLYYKKTVLNQIIIIAILAAVITGSLLTGYSVRKSLQRTAFTRLGNTSILVSSGLRFFNPDLSQRFSEKLGERAVSILEFDGFCQNFSDGTLSKKIKIYGIGSDFFGFQGNDSIFVKAGEVAINRKLAQQINIKAGDEIIIRIREISDIPADAPFSTSSGEGRSIVMRVGKILEPQDGGDFNLAISQIAPSNIFINLDNLTNSADQKPRANRLLVKNINREKLPYFLTILKKTIGLSDLGLTLRKVEMTGENELISDRIFIDQNTIENIRKSIPTAYPIITYLSNSITSGNRETPYSFISALPSELYPEIVKENGIVINRWLASDLKITSGDTITMSWFAPDSINKLKEKSGLFVIKKIVEIDSIWGDRTLMPDFPGISGSKSCSEWDAGVPVKVDRIRKKDEDYWNKFKGTPKAFIAYEKGRELWANNFGPATALRFPAILTTEEIEGKLEVAINPESSGFVITDLRSDALKAASESVDFGTLFLSLSFFIIFSSIILLSLSVSAYFNTKKNQIATLFALGFNNRSIRKSLFLETVFISLSGSIFGVLIGLLVTYFIISALNTVWQGAVQTNTLSASTGFTPIFIGFISTLIIILIFFQVSTRRFLKDMSRKKDGVFELPSLKLNLIFLLASAIITIACFLTSIIMKESSTQLSFMAGVSLLLTSVLLSRQYYLGGLNFSSRTLKSYSGISRLYYRHNPSHSIAPMIFISAGIFSLFITSLNRMNFNAGALDPSGGTGGYLFWSETSVPVTEDLSTEKGKSVFGLNEDQFKEMSIVQLARKEGNDASCLNLNHVISPPLIGIDPIRFIDKEAFSFASVIPDFNESNPWKLINSKLGDNSFYGIADQTVLDWGLKIKCGDTIVMRAETGQPVNIIIAAGLKSSVFQGSVLIGAGNLRKFFPSVSGSSIFLIEGNPRLSDSYKSALEERFVNYGIVVEHASERLASFYQVTNTYLLLYLQCLELLG